MKHTEKYKEKLNEKEREKAYNLKTNKYLEDLKGGFKK